MAFEKRIINEQRSGLTSPKEIERKDVVAVFDVGKTNKKLFLFDVYYQIVFEKSAKFLETLDEDNDTCESIKSLKQSMMEALKEVFADKRFNIKAINFTTYGASFVYIDEDGEELTPLYNYLKTYPADLKQQFYDTYGGEELFSLKTASPVLGSLNSGMQLYRLKYKNPAVFAQVKYALHLPQFMSYQLSGKACTDITSIGCHTNLWDFQKDTYHDWVHQEGIDEKLPEIITADTVLPARFETHEIVTGIGLHDSSAALIPYFTSFKEPFALISTGTWCITLNPFNQHPLTTEELQQDCLCYLSFKGRPVKASRLFSGYIHEQQVKRIATHFKKSNLDYKNFRFEEKIVQKLKSRPEPELNIASLEPDASVFALRNLDDFKNCKEAYHQLIMDLIKMQIVSTNLVLENMLVKRIFVDGGFSKNSIFMNLLALEMPHLEVFAASVAQATALGAALAIHQHWNTKTLPTDIIEIKHYAANNPLTVY
jgi:sugar (pentulose or hexulose) kinase